MKKKPTRHLDLEIDKLTNSIQNTLSGEVFDTQISRISKGDLKVIKKADWQFNWRLESGMPYNEVYKLTTVNNPTIIHGLPSILI